MENSTLTSLMENCTQLIGNETGTHPSSLHSSNTFIATVFFFLICTVAFILNIPALILLKRSKKLHVNRFYRLVLFLSSCNIVSILASLVLVGHVFLEVQDIPYVCFIACLIVSLTSTFSFVQVLMICIERLLAVVNTDRAQKWSNHFDTLYKMAFLFVAIYTICIYCTFGNVSSTSCKLSDTFHENYWLFQITMATVRGIIYGFIVIVYLRILYYLQQQMTRVDLIPDGNEREMMTLNIKVGQKRNRIDTEESKIWTTETTSFDTLPNRQSNVTSITQGTQERRACMQPSTSKLEVPNWSRQTAKSCRIDIQNNAGKHQQTSRQATMQNLPLSFNTNRTGSIHTRKIKSSMSQNRIRRFKTSMATVGIIIIVVSVNVFPVIINLVSAISNGIAVSENVLEFTNGMVVLNPLLDPIIYVFRLKEFRNMFRCQL